MLKPKPDYEKEKKTDRQKTLDVKAELFRIPNMDKSERPKFKIPSHLDLS